MLFHKNKVAPQDDAELSQTQIVNNPAPKCMGICRICLEDDAGLIRPCACTGSMELVHQRCLTSWIEAQRKVNRMGV